MSGDWSRPHWQPSGRAASPFYFVVGDPPIDGLRVRASRHHVGLWSHTGGMRKFGRPALQVKHLPGEFGEHNPLVNLAGKMINDFAGRMARGKIIPDGWRMSYHEDEHAFAFVETPDDSGFE